MSDLITEKKDDALTEKLEAQKQDAELAQKISQHSKSDVSVTVTIETKVERVNRPRNNMANAMASLGSEKKEEKDTAELDKKEEKDAAVADASAPVPEPEKKKTPEPLGKAKVTAAMLRINRSPKDDPVYLGTLRSTDVVNYYGEKDGYLEVHVGNQVGYIAAKHTDKGDKKTDAQKADEQDSKAVEQAPEPLQELLAHDSLNAEQVADARKMIEQSPESMRGDLYEELQLKAEKAVVESEEPTKDEVEYANLATCMTMLGVSNPTPGQSMTNTLMQVKREQKLPESEGMQNWGSVANAMGVNYQALNMSGDRKAEEKTFWLKNVREELRSGQAVMASVDNQAVRIEGVEQEGLVVTLPESVEQSQFSGFTAYNGNTTTTEQKSAGQRGVLSFEALKDKMDWVISMG
ncbi:MAG: hypothetical protein IJ165_03630 [Proteobacteria bacterium]|nr:hypothetical protein [Pseudomonadota bacterium]